MFAWTGRKRRWRRSKQSNRWRTYKGRWGSSRVNLASTANDCEHLWNLLFRQIVRTAKAIHKENMQHEKTKKRKSGGGETRMNVCSLVRKKLFALEDVMWRCLASFRSEGTNWSAHSDWIKLAEYSTQQHMLCFPSRRCLCSSYRVKLYNGKLLLPPNFILPI